VSLADTVVAAEDLIATVYVNGPTDPGKSPPWPPHGATATPAVENAPANVGLICTPPRRRHVDASTDAALATVPTLNAYDTELAALLSVNPAMDAAVSTNDVVALFVTQLYVNRLVALPVVALLTVTAVPLLITVITVLAATLVPVTDMPTCRRAVLAMPSMVVLVCVVLVRLEPSLREMVAL
jgi:hypothetical protein